MNAVPLPPNADLAPAASVGREPGSGFADAHCERLHLLGRMMARVSDQISSPLPAALAEELATDHAPRAPLDDALLARLQQLEALVRQLLVCVRGETGARRPLALAPWLGRLGLDLAARVAASGGSLETRCTLSNAEVLADADALATAVQAMLDAWPPCARGYRVLLTLAAADDGTPELALARHGTDDRPIGSGRVAPVSLGTTAAGIIARAHGGTLDERCDTGGFRLVLRLPRRAAARQSAA